MEEKDKRLLTRVENRISFLYIDKARIEQTEYGVCVIQGSKVVDIPITTINCIILGPGVSITHKAVCNIASAGCSICFTGSDVSVFYAYGAPATNKAKNLLTQIKYHENKNLHLKVVHKMYELRYPESRLKTKTIEELRGIEGKKVKERYEECAKESGITWTGRSYKTGEFEEQDIINKYITALNHTLYAITTAAIVALGFSQAIGFIHTGHIQAFVFDIADLYKEKYIIPLAFDLAKNEYYDRHKMLKAFRSIIVEENLMSQIVKDIIMLFQTEEDEYEDISIEAELQLWGDKSFGIFGKNYAEEP